MRDADEACGQGDYMSIRVQAPVVNCRPEKVQCLEGHRFERVSVLLCDGALCCKVRCPVCLGGGWLSFLLKTHQARHARRDHLVVVELVRCPVRGHDNFLQDRCPDAPLLNHTYSSQVVVSWDFV